MYFLKYTAENPVIECPWCQKILKKEQIVSLGDPEEEGAEINESAKLNYLFDRLQELWKKDPTRKIIIFTQL